MLLSLVAMLAGLLIVVKSADLLVDNGSRLAASFGVPTLVIGLTIVAYGTSAPEAVVSVTSAARGAGALVVGNVLGSNVANLALILGAAALAAPLSLPQRVGRVDGPLVLLATLLFALLGSDGSLSRADGAVLLLLSIVYSAGAVLSARREATPPAPHETAGRGRTTALLLLGLAGLAVGAQMLVSGAVAIATKLGLSELLIGATIIAVGTSLPELAASIAAARADDHGMSVGNVIGSNLFNLLLVLGLGALVGGVPMPRPALLYDLIPGLVLAALMTVAALRGMVVTRLAGGLLLASYAAYLGLCVWRQVSGVG